MTKENSDGTKRIARATQDRFSLGYSLALRMVRGEACVFCQATFTAQDRNNPEGIGEFFNHYLHSSFLAHPDCVPGGVDAIQQGQDPEWSMA